MNRLMLSSLLFGLLFLVGCSSSDSPKSISSDFWQAVQERDMESAKQLSTWDTVDYLKILKADKLHPERFELGEALIGDSHAEVTTTLFTTKLGKSGVKVPGVTVLEKTKKGWRVNVKKTLGSVVKHSMGNMLDQLNSFMQDGIIELDKTFSESMNELGKALEEGAEELRKELSKPLRPQNKAPKLQSPDGQQI